MDYTDNYKISNQKVLSRLIPYFIRGRKFYSYLLAILSPLEDTHAGFLEWAQSTITTAKTEFVKRPMEVMLKRNLESYFANGDDEFSFDKYAHKNYNYYVDTVENTTDQIYAYPANVDIAEEDIIYCYDTTSVTGRTKNAFNLSAPNIVDSGLMEEYKTKIKKYIAQYSIIRRYDIIIQDL